MKKVYRMSLGLLSLVLVTGLALPLVASAEMVKKVDNFVVFMDQSGSMAYANAQAGHQKFDYVVKDVARLDQAAPELGYTSAAALFAPFKMITEPVTHKTGSLGSAAAGVVPPFNYMTPMGDGLSSLDPVLGKLPGKTAVIMFTDGAANQGPDPVAAAKALYGKYAPNLCIHVVSYADTPEGQAVIDQIRALSGCTVVADHKSLETDAAMAQFAKDVLYDDVAPKPAPVVMPAPVRAPAPAPVAKEVITFNLLFDFDKSDIKSEMVPILEQAKVILGEDPAADFTVSGHTDWTGEEAYNQGLSERRAASVKNWLVTNGVSGSRLSTVGYGETQPKYDNSTKEGRRLNRRVELQTK